MRQVIGCLVKDISYTQAENISKTTIFMIIIFRKPHDIVFRFNGPCPAELRDFSVKVAVIPENPQDSNRAF